MKLHISLELRFQRIDQRNLGLFHKSNTLRKSLSDSECKIVNSLILLWQNSETLSRRLCPKTSEEKEQMSKVPYLSVVGSLIYAMMCTRLDI